MPRTAELIAIARLEWGEVRRSRWLLFAGSVYLAIAAIFVLVGLRESSVLGFTGMGKVLVSLSHALVLLLPLLGLAASGQAVNRARDDGTLEVLFSHPVSRGGYFTAVAAVRFLSLAVPFVALVPALGIAGRLAFGQAVPWAIVARVTAVGASLLLASVAAGMCISTYVRSPAKALMALLLVWALSIALVDFGLAGLMLEWRLRPEAVFALATLNPVQSARMALLVTAEPELGTLGPVGFYLAHRIGPDALVGLGIAWPALLAGAVLALTRRRFGRGDLV